MRQAKMALSLSAVVADNACPECRDIPGAHTQGGCVVSTYCKNIYTGCCATGCQGPCGPCERIAKGKSTVEKEMARKLKLEKRKVRQ